MNILDYARINKNNFSYPEDIKRMIEVCNKKGVTITPELAEKLWYMHSDDNCACWLILPKDDDSLFETLLNCAKEYITND